MLPSSTLDIFWVRQAFFLELEEQSHPNSVLFSGDLGNTGRLLLRSPTTPPQAENVVMETTYGDRLHKPLGLSVDELFDVPRLSNGAETS